MSRRVGTSNDRRVRGPCDIRSSIATLAMRSTSTSVSRRCSARTSVLSLASALSRSGSGEAQSIMSHRRKLPWSRQLLLVAQGRHQTRRFRGDRQPATPPGIAWRHEGERADPAGPRAIVCASSASRCDYRMRDRCAGRHWLFVAYAGRAPRLRTVEDPCRGRLEALVRHQRSFSRDTVSSGQRTTACDGACVTHRVIAELSVR